jgi:hypothetical protein
MLFGVLQRRFSSNEEPEKSAIRVDSSRQDEDKKSAKENSTKSMGGIPSLKILLRKSPIPIPNIADLKLKSKVSMPSLSILVPVERNIVVFPGRGSNVNLIVAIAFGFMALVSPLQVQATERTFTVSLLRLVDSFVTICRILEVTKLDSMLDFSVQASHVEGFFSIL